MKKMKKIGLLAASALMTGVAAAAPLAGVPSTVMATESDSLKLNIKENDRGEIISSATDRVDVGEVFTIEAKPYDGYRFAYWELKAGSANSGYEIVDGELSDEKISVRADELAGNVFSVNAVFISSDEHVVLNDFTYTVAKTGDVIDVSDYIRSYHGEDDEVVFFGHSDVSIHRLDDIYANVTADVFDEESKTVTVPDYDIRIVQEKLVGSYSKVLDSEIVLGEETAFAIEDATGGLAALPESAVPGDEVEITTVQPEISGDEGLKAFVTAYYRIERVSDGRDMTETIMVEGSNDRFIMPYYDVRIVADTFNSGVVALGSTNEEAEPAGDEEYQEKVLAEFYPGSEGEEATGGEAKTESKEELSAADAAGDSVQPEASVVSGDVQATAKDDKEADKADTKDNTATDVIADVKKAAPSQPSTRIAANGSASSQNAAKAPVYSPAVRRSEGGNSASANSVSAPATGDYNITGIVTFAAVAAGIGIVAAAVMMKKKMVD